jgi:hypothetical protein
MDLKNIFGGKDAPEAGLDAPGASAAQPEAKPAKVSTPIELVSPHAQGNVNALISAAVREAVQAAVAGTFAELKPFLEGMALTPEKIKAIQTKAKTPEEIAAALREERENKNSRENDAQSRREKLAMQQRCPHLDDAGNEAIGLLRNYQDRQPRGLCMKCNYLIEPKRWVIGAPYPMDYPDPALRGKDHAYVVDADPLYPRVLRLAAKS